MPVSSERARILLVDDSATTLEVLQRNLVAAGYEVLTAASVDGALQILELTPVDLVVTDLKMPRVSGMELVRHVRENHGDTEVMVITGYPSVESAVEAVKTGAEQYLTKPFTDAELLDAVASSLDKLNRRRAAEGETASVEAPGGLVGSSKAMRAVHRAVLKAARTSATVLVLGESGTGKELVARAIHYAGSRASAPFVPVNCGGIPDGLLESELFGHMKGAFTGADVTRAGFFQTADGGTIFLDEISETPPAMQVKLLRVLQDKQVAMVGSSTPRTVDVRIVAASNKDLVTLVSKGVFREDLFFRLNVVTITVPPLRDRDDDFLLLIRRFADKFAVEFGSSPPRFTDRALEALRRYSWPGNVRELENLVQRLVVMVEGAEVDVTDLPAHIRYAAPRDGGVQRTLADVEHEHIRLVLAHVGGNKTKAAEILGIDRKTLRQKLRRE